VELCDTGVTVLLIGEARSSTSKGACLDQDKTIDPALCDDVPLRAGRPIPLCTAPSMGAPLSKGCRGCRHASLWAAAETQEELGAR
jgi:hypothetical protein